MKFIEQDEQGTWQLTSYAAYLADNAHLFPPGVQKYLAAIDLFRLGEPNSIHDANLLEISIKDRLPSDLLNLNQEQPGPGIRIYLVGPFRDRYIAIDYIDVSSYEIGKREFIRGLWDTLHGDWILDELLIREDGLVEQEIIFSNGRTIWIAFRDLKLSINFR